MHYILIDYENVQPDIWHIADDFEVDVTVFVGPRQRVNPKTSEVIHRMDTRGEVIKVCNAGPNALDFHLAFHLGQLVMSDATSTFEIVSNESARGITDVQLNTGVPIANAVLTTENDDQALVRMAQKGAEAAQAAIEMANLLKALKLTGGK